MSSESEFQFEKESDLSVNEIKVMYDDFVNPGLSKLYQFFLLITMGKIDL